MRFRVHGADGVRELDVPIEMVVIAGWSGRDAAAVRHHIEELAAIGVAGPSTTPLFYRVGADRLTQAATVQVLGHDSSGEAEAVLVGTTEGMIVAVGSDHTDRKVEGYSVAVSKQLCPKPISTDAWWFEDVAGRWDELELSSDRLGPSKEGDAGTAYQRGTLAAIRPPIELVATYFDGYKAMPPGFVMFLGTIPAIGGVRGAERFRIGLRDPRSGRALAHTYRTFSLPVVA